MIIDLELAKQEYILRNNINDRDVINSIVMAYRGADKFNRAVFDVYSLDNPTPLGWALDKYDVSQFKNENSYWEFPRADRINPVSVAVYINRKTNLGMRASDIAFVTEINVNQCQVMMSLDSMYFTNSFMLSIV